MVIYQFIQFENVENLAFWTICKTFEKWMSILKKSDLAVSLQFYIFWGSLLCVGSLAILEKLKIWKFESLENLKSWKKWMFEDVVEFVIYENLKFWKIVILKNGNLEDWTFGRFKK